MANLETKEQGAQKQDEKKYLAIRKWSKFQSMTDAHGKSLEGRRREWIRDYCEKETDILYADLSLMGRYLIDACRRLRGKLGRNLPNDHMWILRQLDVHHMERGPATHALQMLVGVPHKPFLNSYGCSDRIKPGSVAVSHCVRA